MSLMKFIYLFCSILCVSCITQNKISLEEKADEVFLYDNHTESIKLYSKLIQSKKDTNKCFYYYRRAYSYFLIKDYKKALIDVNKSFVGGLVKIVLILVFPKFLLPEVAQLIISVVILVVPILPGVPRNATNN